MGFGLLVAPLRSGAIAQSTDTDNATATATVTAVEGTSHVHAGCWVEYSAAPAAGFKTVVFKKGTTTIATLRFDPSFGPQAVPFPVGVPGDVGGAISAELQASGTGTVTGRITLFYFDR